MLNFALGRRIVGTASVILLLALGYVGLQWSMAPPAGSYQVEAVLGRAGSGLNEGTDVKVRGVRIGKVASIRYEDATAIATLEIEPQPKLPDPSRLGLVVTAKTLLGEKQVEISFPDGEFNEAPFLEAGDTIVADVPPTEVQEVLDKMEPFLDAIDPEDLASIVDALGQQRGEGERIAENLEVGEELAAFGARTADDQIDRFRSFSNVVRSLENRADDIVRAADTTAAATRVLRTEQAQIRSALDALSTFSITLAEFFEVEQGRLERLLVTGDAVGAVLDRNMPRLGEIVQGIYLYARSFPQGGLLNDGTEFAYFRILLGGGDFAAQLCRNAGDFAQYIPACESGDDGGGSP